jgi:hypothetical protein
MQKDFNARFPLPKSMTAGLANSRDKDLIVKGGDGWPRLSPELTSSLPEHEQLLLRQHEEETIAANKMQLEDLLKNCNIQPQFAKTYRVLRRDLRQMLEKGRDRLRQPQPGVSDGFGMALVLSTDAIISYKLRCMEEHFWVRWGEPIERWAGPEGSAMDKAGCVVVIATAIAGAGMACLPLLTSVW